MELVTGCPLFRGCLSIEVNGRTVKTLELSIVLWMSAAEGCPLSGVPLYRVYCIYLPSSLVPWPLLFLPSICIQNNTREWKIGEKRRRPGNIHNVSGCKVNVGGEGPIFKYVRTKLESNFLLVKTSSFDHANSSSPNCNRAFEQIIQCVVLAPPSLCPPCVHVTS